MAESKIKKIRSPKKDQEFKKYWNKYILKVQLKKNFDKHHLETLRIFCDLYVWYDELQEFLKENGMSEITHGRYGTQIKTYPEVAQMNNVLKEIRMYTKILGLEISEEEKPEDKGSDWT